jgi:mannose-6-phosphate isomerase-like protein (cupin superfamily)
MSYTKKNLREVEDLAARAGLSENQEARFPRDDLKAEETGLSYQVLRPGKRHAFAHRQKELEEIYVILSGNGRAKLDDEIVEVGAMDAIRVAPQVARAFEADDEGLEILVFGPHRDDDAVIIEEDFWGG